MAIIWVIELSSRFNLYDAESVIEVFSKAHQFEAMYELTIINFSWHDINLVHRKHCSPRYIWIHSRFVAFRDWRA